MFIAEKRPVLNSPPPKGIFKGTPSVQMITGLNKPQRQEKVVQLFRKHFPSRPTVVLDQGLLAWHCKNEDGEDVSLPEEVLKLIPQATGSMAPA